LNCFFVLAKRRVFRDSEKERAKVEAARVEQEHWSGAQAMAIKDQPIVRRRDIKVLRAPRSVLTCRKKSPIVTTVGTCRSKDDKAHDSSPRGTTLQERKNVNENLLQEGKDSAGSSGRGGLDSGEKNTGVSGWRVPTWKL